MTIACIGWGSLIWYPDGLKIQNAWFEDGPILKIELTRHSDNDRITLIIDDNEATMPVRTLWSLMTTENLEEAKLSLKEREGTIDSNIHVVLKDEDTNDRIKIAIRNWLKAKDLDAAIWTGLSYGRKTNNVRPTIDYVLNHLKGLEYEKRKVAEEYIRKAPRQIDTVFRRRIEIELGWSPVE